jgi:predicted DCC family thiol-disulfide oxidoreductase YuxK
VITELSDKKVESDTVFYDAYCPFCRRTVALLRRVLPPHHVFRFVPFQSLEAKQRLGAEAEVLTEMKVCRPDGSLIGGAEASVYLAHFVWWAWPLRIINKTAAGRLLLDRCYCWVAGHRYCIRGRCRIEADDSVIVGLKFLAFPFTACVVGVHFRPWQFMWLLAASIYAGCKWLTWRSAFFKPMSSRALSYLLLWPGMDPAPFVDRARRSKPVIAPWFFAISKIFCGSALIWLMARKFWPGTPLAAGWLGMVGMILLLHCGLFHLLALILRQFGIRVTPIMDRPLLAKSTSEFWSWRWNRSFNDLVRRYAFRPLLTRFGLATATLGSFLASGLIHDLVISVPARGGYGLPTLYFLLQGTAVLFEHSRIGKQIRVRHGFHSRLFALLVIAAPASWLFHRPFVQHVMLPFLSAIGAL